MRILEKKNLAVVFLLAILAGNAFFLNYNAFRCFNLLDMGGFLDASWRVFRGQRPYMDFIYYSGPVHLYMNAFFFHLFGFGKAAILTHLITVHSIVITLVFLMLYRRLPLSLVFLITLLTVPSFYWNVSHPWHDQSTHLFGLTGVALLVRQIFAKSAKIFWTAVWCAVLGMIAVIVKTNLGAAYFLLLGLVLLAFDQRRKAMTGYLLGMVAGAGIALLIIHYPAEYFQQSVVDNHVLLQRRLSGLLNPVLWFVNYYWVMAGVVLIHALLHKEHTKAHKELLALFFGVSGLGVYAAMSGGVLISANNFLWGPHMALAALVLWHLRKPVPFQPLFKKIYLAETAFFVLFTLFLMFISVHDGLQLKVWTYVKWRPLGNYVLKSKPFDGWLAYQKQGEPLDNLVAYIRTHVPETDSLLNLTDMFIIYSLTGRDSFRGITCTYIEGIIPNPGRQVEQVRKNILSHLPEWVVLSVDAIPVELRYLGIQQEILTSYQPVVRTGPYFLLKKK